nr:uncharacterized protein LOC118877176 isoform X2 [Drosophila suzukii]
MHWALDNYRFLYFRGGNLGLGDMMQQALRKAPQRLNGIPEAVSEHNNYPTPAEADLKGIALVTTHITFRNFSGLG